MSALEVMEIAHPSGQGGSLTVYYEVVLDISGNDGSPVTWVKYHSLTEVGSTAKLGGNDSYQQTILNTYLNNFKVFKIRNVEVVYKPFYNTFIAPVAPLTEISNTSGTATSFQFTAPVKQGQPCSIRKLLVNMDAYDWNPVTDFGKLKRLQLMKNTIRGVTTSELSWSYVPKTQSGMLSDFQTTGTLSQSKKIESADQWFNCKVYTSGSSIPSGFNPMTFIGCNISIYDLAGRQSNTSLPGGITITNIDWPGWLEFTVTYDFGIYDKDTWIGSLPNSVTSNGNFTTQTGTKITNDGQAGTTN